MRHDSLYQKIVEGLDGELDGNHFQACAADLIRADYPGLVPIPGGSDHGWDGAVPDPDGPTFPLFCTVQKDAKANLTKNIKSYVEHGGVARRIIFATSRALTPHQKRQLHSAAEESGFELVTIYDQPGIANRLYESPKWRKDLLGLAGTPAALSLLPRDARFSIGQPLIAREADSDWLADTVGDALLVGQPGLGKTALLYAHAAKVGGQFVNRDDTTSIADCIRRDKPPVLILDDAHLKLELLQTLMHLRKDIGAKFRLIASSWPAETDGVLRLMGIPASASRELPLLGRDDMVKVIEAAGVVSPPIIIKEILNQAEGRPGLAVLLCRMVLLGGIKELSRGDALARDIKETYRQLVGEAAIPVLAIYSVGGSDGMDTSIVAAELGLSLLDVHRIVGRLSAGGVLVQIHNNRFSVRPEALRHALVRDLFFSKNPISSIETLIDVAPNRHSAVDTVLHARHRGGDITEEKLRQLLQSVDSPDLWASYANLGRQQTEWVLSNRAQYLTTLAYPGLRFAPNVIIPMLLDKAVGDRRETFSTPDQPLRIIEDWVCGGYPGRNQAVPRRKALLDAVLKWAAKDGNADTAARAAVLSLSPKYVATDTKPGSGREMVFSRGSVTLGEMREITALWPSMLAAFGTMRISNWSPILEELGDWASPGRVNERIPADVAAEMIEFAKKAIKEFAPLVHGHRGFATHLSRLAERLQVDLGIAADSEFDIVYPQRPFREDWKDAFRKQHERAVALGQQWANESPSSVVKRIAAFEIEADGANLGSGQIRVACEAAALKAASPDSWLREMMSIGVSGMAAESFISECIKRGMASDVLLDCLMDDRLRMHTAAAVLIATQASSDLLRRALDRLSGMEDWIETLVLRGQVAEDRVRLLLEHGDPRIAGSAAVGEWVADPEGSVRIGLSEQWRNAAVQCPPTIRGIEDILKADKVIALAWLKRLIEKGDPPLWMCDNAISMAVCGLGKPERIGLLSSLPNDYRGTDTLRMLVGDDHEVYQAVLACERLRPIHLEPLTEAVSSNWIRMAQAAMDVGYTPKEIAAATTGRGWSWSGKESTLWAEWKKAYEQLSGDKDIRIQEVGRIAADYCGQQEQAAVAREKQEEVLGI